MTKIYIFKCNDFNRRFLLEYDVINNYLFPILNFLLIKIFNLCIKYFSDIIIVIYAI